MECQHFLRSRLLAYSHVYLVHTHAGFRLLLLVVWWLECVHLYGVWCWLFALYGITLHIKFNLPLPLSLSFLCSSLLFDCRSLCFLYMFYPNGSVCVVGCYRSYQFDEENDDATVSDPVLPILFNVRQCFIEYRQKVCCLYSQTTHTNTNEPSLFCSNCAPSIARSPSHFLRL